MAEDRKMGFSPVRGGYGHLVPEGCITNGGREEAAVVSRGRDTALLA